MIFLAYLNVDKKNKIMNIFEEIAERYTYNGVVSLKALDDDIVTLENQIDSWLSTLNELRLRGKNSSIIVEKIRDGKIRLSLLRAVYKRESDKTAPDDVIADMLGISAKNASEVETPGTAADNKEPVLQNFEKAEIEAVDESKTEPISVNEDKTSQSIVSNSVTVESLNKDDDKVVIKNHILEESKHEPVSEAPSKSYEDSVFVKNEKEQEEEVMTYPMEEMTKMSEGVIVVPDNPEREDTKVTETVADTSKEVQPVKVKVEDISKDASESVTVTVGNYTEATADTECVSRYNLSGFTEESDFFTRFKVEKDNGDSIGPVLKNAPETSQKNLSVVTEVEHKEAENDDKIVEPYNEKFSVDTRVTTNNPDFDMDDFDVYEPFSKEEARIVESADLFNVTDMPNTMYVYTRADFKKRLLHARFVDIRDYGVFVELLKQREEERCNFLKRLLKKPQSIFIYVTTVVSGKEKIYKYEFTDCKLVDAFDDEYASKAYIDSISDPYTCNTNCHNCGVTFKYKKLIIT